MANSSHAILVEKAQIFAMEFGHSEWSLVCETVDDFRPRYCKDSDLFESWLRDVNRKMVSDRLTWELLLQ